MKLGVISLKLLGGKLAPKLIQIIMKTELLNISHMVLSLSCKTKGLLWPAKLGY